MRNIMSMDYLIMKSGIQKIKKGWCQSQHSGKNIDTSNPTYTVATITDLILGLHL